MSYLGFDLDTEVIRNRISVAGSCSAADAVALIEALDQLRLWHRQHTDDLLTKIESKEVQVVGLTRANRDLLSRLGQAEMAEAEANSRVHAMASLTADLVIERDEAVQEIVSTDLT